MDAVEVITGALHRAFPMEDAPRVGEARRHGAELAAAAGLDETEAGRLAIIVTELGNNLLRHAREGRLLLAARAGSGEVEVIAMDRGPGIADVQRCMQDGFSTGGTPGTGLGAVRRMAQDFDVHSSMPEGTVILARVRNASKHSRTARSIRGGGVAIAAPGEWVCGDAWAFGLNGTRGSVIVADGLGHGPDAAEAADAAIGVFAAEPLAAPRTVIERAHARLRSTRGAAVALLALDTQAATIRSSGAGNICARVISGVSDKTILSQHGTVGLQIRRPDEITQPWPDHAIVVLHTDGIETRWPSALLAPVLRRDPTLAAALLLRDHCRGRDDATVVVLRRED